MKMSSCKQHLSRKETLKYHTNDVVVVNDGGIILKPYNVVTLSVVK